MSAYFVCASVRGIGVAVIASVCGAALFSRSVLRWLTPKRCCSSITTRPSSRNDTLSVSSACVPTASAASPDAIRSCGAAALARALRAEHRFDGDAERQQQRCELGRVLRGEDLGRRHQRGLHAALVREHDRRGGDERLAAADVALQQAVHRRGAPHVAPDAVDHAALRGGRRERQLGDERVPRAVRDGQRVRAAGRFAARAFHRGGERDREELVEDDPLARPRDRLGVVRRVDVAPRPRQRRKAEAPHERGRQRVGVGGDQAVEVLCDDGCGSAGSAALSSRRTPG